MRCRGWQLLLVSVTLSQTASGIKLPHRVTAVRDRLRVDDGFCILNQVKANQIRWRETRHWDWDIAGTAGPNTNLVGVGGF